MSAALGHVAPPPRGTGSQHDAEVSASASMTTTEAREYLVKFMEQHFTDKTFHRYIRGQRREVNLAGDFAWQMARALRMIQVSTETGAPSHPAGPAAGGHGE